MHILLHVEEGRTLTVRELLGLLERKGIETVVLSMCLHSPS